VRNLWSNWVKAVRFACEAQGVISLRMLLFATGGRGSSDEAFLMIAEKVDAFAEAEVAAGQALMNGRGLEIAAERAFATLQRRVHANSLRLLHTAH
jgi:hypothetical protein